MCPADRITGPGTHYATDNGSAHVFLIDQDTGNRTGSGTDHRAFGC